MSQDRGLGECSVRADVGASIKRDALDIRLLGVDGFGGEYEVNGGTIVDNPDEVGGWPILSIAPAPEDDDKDGIPDVEEEKYGAGSFWQLNAGNAQLDDDGDGHTNLEQYLNELVEKLKGD